MQEERQRTKERDQNEVESTSSLHTDMPVERILEAEKRVECKTENQVELEVMSSGVLYITKVDKCTRYMLEHDIGKCVCVKNSCSIPLDFIVIF
jgi:hypothetical protein